MNIIKRAKNSAVILLLAVLASAPCFARAAALDLDAARSLIETGKPAQAYALLEPFEFEQAGNTQFDYLLGLAALNSGKAARATLILDRVLAVDPQFAAALVDLGRAYYVLGDDDRARAAFDRAQQLNPPPSALATIRQHMAMIENRGKRAPTRFTGYLEAGAGYNNNVNTSTSQDRVTIPVLLNIQVALNAANIKTADSYLGLAAGGEGVHPLSSDWSLFAGADANSRHDFNYANFNYVTLDGRLGANFTRDADQFKAGLVAGQFNLGGAVNRRSIGLNAEWRHACNDRNQAVWFGQDVHYRFPDAALATNDFNQAIAGLGWVHGVADGRANLFGSLYAGKEHDTHSRIDGGKRLQGLRFTGQAAIAAKLEMQASGGVQWGTYDRINSAFLVKRDDTLIDISVGLNYRYLPDWMLRPQISLVHNRSNIIINRYNQADFSVSLRRVFK